MLELPTQRNNGRRMLGGNAIQLKQMNLRMVLQLLRQHKMLSRADLARHTGLNTSTTSSLATELIESGLVRECGRGILISAGRPPEMLELSPDARYALGVYVGDIQCLGVIADLGGQTRAAFRMDTPMTGDSSSILALVIDEARAMLADWNGPRNRLLGVGLGLTGLVDAATGTALFSPNLGWENVPVHDLWQDALQLPVFVDNDMHALALGEQWFGLGQTARSLACLHVGAGIGCGVVMDGRIYRGGTGGGGEIGHNVVDVNGPLCRCGNYGCLETLGGGQAVVAHVARGLLASVPSTLSALTENDPRRLSLSMICEAARSGDRLAQRALEQTVQFTGIAVSNAINTFNPNLVVLSGELFDEGADLILDLVIEHARRHAYGPAAKSTPICTTRLGKHASALGTACLVFQEWLAGTLDAQYEP
jgi:N-acetylglucosamine repressor